MFKNRIHCLDNSWPCCYLYAYRQWHPNIQKRKKCKIEILVKTNIVINGNEFTESVSHKENNRCVANHDNSEYKKNMYVIESCYMHHTRTH